MASEPKSVASKIPQEELLDFLGMAEAHLEKSNTLMRDYYFGFLGKNEELISELMRLTYNSKTFKDYSIKLISAKEVQEDNLIHLYLEELVNITKCAVALVESKASLKLYGISLDQQ